MIWSLAATLAKTLPGEPAHRLAVKSLAAGLGPDHRNRLKSDRLMTQVAGIECANPLGLAAGFDKNAECMVGALKLGFGFVEVGTITPKAQPGNPKPRVFRLAADGAVINRYGFNNDGIDPARARLDAYRLKTNGGIIGVNIGANKDAKDRVADYYTTAYHLAVYADYITVNVSSPNTPGLRGLQEPHVLKNVLDAAKSGMTDAGHLRPIFLKIAPDLDDQGLIDAIDTAQSAELSGMIISNTTIARPSTLTHPYKAQAGGLSGQPLLVPSSIMLAKAAAHLNASSSLSNFPLIAAGGVSSAHTAYLKILLGASLVQVYTALAIHGPDLPKTIISGLDQLLAQDGYDHVDDARGAIPDIDAALRHVGIPRV